MLVWAALMCAAAAAFGMAGAATAAADDHPGQPTSGGLLGTVTGTLGSTVATLTAPGHAAADPDS